MQQRTTSADPDKQKLNRLTRIGTLAAWASLGSLFYYSHRGELLMHGDAVAHINIARRVFDSLYPGPLQLGTVWLPLPHVVMIPFIWPDKMWQSGIGGAIPSMIAYVLGVVGIFRLVEVLLAAGKRGQERRKDQNPDAEPNGTGAQIGGYIAAFVYAANPNLLYTQTTALTETLELAFFIWAIVYFGDFVREAGEHELTSEARRALRNCGLCVACAELTRYDGWFLAGMLGVIVAAMAVSHWRHRILRGSVIKFLFGVAAAPALWLTYNAAIYGNALAFATGPYSAKAIEARVGAPNPGAHHLLTAAAYFLKSAQINLAVGNWGRFWLAAALFATAIVMWKRPRKTALAMLALLWCPVLFYAYSIAYGSVPLHVPMWWPFAIFNQRFGLELLPVFAVSAGVLVSQLLSGRFAAREWKIVAAAVALVLISYGFVWRAKPACWQEAEHNWDIRRGLDTAVLLDIKELPRPAIFLMDIDEHVGIMERLGIPLRTVINNEDRRQWVHPRDPDGTWERALADPGRYVNFVIAFEGDMVDKNLNTESLKLLEVIHSSGQPPARIYQTMLAVNQRH